MKRITEKQLKGIVKRLNELTGNPTETYTKIDDKFIANIGNYHLDSAYGGHSLVQLSNDGGGVRSVSNIGFAPKRELYNWIYAYIQGVETRKEL